MRTNRIVLAAIFMSLSVACSTKTSSVTTTQSDKTSNFRLDDSDFSHLREVGCRTDGITPHCDEITSDQFVSSADRGQLLRAMQRRLEARRRADADVRTSLSKYHETDAALLSANLLAIDADLLVRITSKSLEISQEEMFQNVLGYKCTGPNLSELIIKSADFAKDVSKPEMNLVKGALKFNSKDQIIDWHVAEQMSPSTETGKYFVQTDGEFKLIRNTATPTPLSCYRQRVSQNQNAISDRALERHSMKCTTSFKLSSEPNKTLSGWSLNFETHAHDKNEILYLAGQNLKADDEVTKSLPVWKQPYLSRVISNEGLIKFEIYNQKTNKTLLEVTTSNSTLTFNMGFVDPSGDGLIVQCDGK